MAAREKIEEKKNSIPHHRIESKNKFQSKFEKNEKKGLLVHYPIKWRHMAVLLLHRNRDLAKRKKDMEFAV